MENKSNLKTMGSYLSITIVILSIVFYHLLQKNIPQNVHPIFSLIVTYSTALIFSILLLLLIPLKGSLIEVIKQINYTSYFLGFAIIGIELGYLLAYRNGWKLSFTSAFSSAFAFGILVIAGVFIFKENVSPIKIIGLIFCLIGITLLSLR